MARNWNKEETLLALSLYLQTPYGKIHDSNPDIIKLAKALDRSSGSVGMKMLNLAALNPNVIASGRVGLQNYSKLDASIWQEYSSDWDELSKQAEKLDSVFAKGQLASSVAETKSTFNLQPPTGATMAESLVEQRRGQSYFRRIVMANYQEKCCITGIAEPKLLVASHIKSWKADETNRLNPANGLALSATFDKAFDKGLLTISHDLRVKVSDRLLAHPNAETRECFEPYHGVLIAEADRFVPQQEFIDWHNDFFEKQAA
ncbi:HNH endonuclease [Parasphingopyxis lamellibrachiae]|uniref:Putative restriction endonuclease n=1 Tax=Parasphingopyxis lamellibrachiae TaxID=680125 RepID=A0A3D9FFN9_9SPHN|nr:HNH endonuclease [Parasphingopyxis lamellibrachiae]RED16599.1 putative restriction endonuclease [Parasphingopyxis lamellibrachiae]